MWGKNDYIIYGIKIYYTCLCSILIFIKITKLKIISKKDFIIVVLFISIPDLLCTILSVKTVFSTLILFFSMCICLSIIIKKNIGFIMLSNIISFSIYFVSYFISISLAFFIQNIFKIKNKYVYIVFIILIQQIILILFFKFKRFKNGFQFLNTINVKKSLDVTLIGISSIILYLYSILTYNFEIAPNDDMKYIGRNATIYLYYSIIYFSIIMIIMIKESLTLSYKQKLLENTLLDYEKQIKEKDEKIQKLSDEKFRISKLNHEFYNRQEALLLKVENTLSNMNFETAEELDLKDKIKSLSNEYTKKLNENKLDSNFPKTNIEEIDDMFTYMNSECIKNGIEFILQVNGNINHLINNYIDKTKLVTLIGDHLRDAIIAVNYSSNKYKSILAILGIKYENYEFCIYDSGIEFQIETYNKLCIEPATTHKDNGGTGIGFITTFETLKETKASLIIEELNELRENSYTKAIRFIFDTKNEFNIISYREELLKEKVNSDIFKIKTKKDGLNLK